MTTADSDCIRSCLNGHPDAYQQLVRRYQTPLLSFLLARLGDQERAEEAAQETFVRAFFVLNRLKHPTSFFSWLLGIAGRVVSEQCRSERRRQTAVKSMPNRSAETPVTNDAQLHRALAELPERYAEVVHLRFYGGMTCAEVAERLDVPLGTVTKRLSRAYALLRESLRQFDRQRDLCEVR